MIIERVGIINGVSAKRNNSTENVVFLQAEVRLVTDLPTEYSYDDKTRTDVMNISFPVSSGIQAGDVITVTVETASPVGERFPAALEASVSE